MTSLVNRYKVWCNEEGKYEYVWGTEVPTTCPNNNAHTIDDTKTVISEQVQESIPMSRIIEGKVAVHSSSKPEPPGVETFVVWSGAGDDMTAATEVNCGNGETMVFNNTIGTPTLSKDIKFDPAHGRVWIHEAYLKFEDGGFQDYVTANIVAPGSILIDHTVSLDCNIDGNGLVTYAGPGAGTHGFGGTPVLLPRTFANDGYWSYDGENLLPAPGGDGNYNININETPVHRYVNKIPCFGTSSTYFTMSSDETAELPVSSGYFLRVTCHNLSNTNWNLSVIMEIYRERTIY